MKKLSFLLLFVVHVVSVFGCPIEVCPNNVEEITKRIKEDDPTLEEFIVPIEKLRLRAEPLFQVLLEKPSFLKVTTIKEDSLYKFEKGDGNLETICEIIFKITSKYGSKVLVGPSNVDTIVERVSEDDPRLREIFIFVKSLGADAIRLFDVLLRKKTFLKITTMMDGVLYKVERSDGDFETIRKTFLQIVEKHIKQTIFAVFDMDEVSAQKQWSETFQCNSLVKYWLYENQEFSVFNRIDPIFVLLNCLPMHGKAYFLENAIEGLDKMVRELSYTILDKMVRELGFPIEEGWIWGYHSVVKFDILMHRFFIGCELDPCKTNAMLFNLLKESFKESWKEGPDRDEIYEKLNKVFWPEIKKIFHRIAPEEFDFSRVEVKDVSLEEKYRIMEQEACSFYKIWDHTTLFRKNSFIQVTLELLHFLQKSSPETGATHP